MKKRMFYKIVFSLGLLITITACGNNSTETKTEETTHLESNSPIEPQKKLVGYLIDAPIVNMGYRCGEIEAKTDSDGKFECLSLPIVFNIGEFEIGKIDNIPTDGIIYPQDLAKVERDDIDNPKVLRIASFLQSLDSDGDLSKTIDIPNDLNINSSKRLEELTQEEANQLLEMEGIEPVTLKEAEKHLRENLFHETSRATTENQSHSNNNRDENTPPPSSPPTSSSVDNYPYIPKAIDTTTAIRFLNKATFGATQKDIKHIQKIGIEAWIDKQLAMPLQDNIYLSKMIKLAKEAEPTINPYSVDEYLADNDKVFNKERASFHSPRYRMSAWFDIALTSNDQLRHKLAYALSQIIVESDFEPIFTRRGDALGRYFDILQKNAFGSYQNLLNDISFSSGMGLFLTYNGNKKKYINEALEDLTPREQKILKIRFGLEDGITHTLEEVGQEFGVTRERIRQIESKALEKIRDQENSEKLRHY